MCGVLFFLFICLPTSYNIICVNAFVTVTNGADENNDGMTWSESRRTSVSTEILITEPERRRNLSSWDAFLSLSINTIDLKRMISESINHGRYVGRFRRRACPRRRRRSGGTIEYGGGVEYPTCAKIDAASPHFPNFPASSRRRDTVDAIQIWMQRPSVDTPSSVASTGFDVKTARWTDKQSLSHIVMREFRVCMTDIRCRGPVIYEWHFVEKRDAINCEGKYIATEGSFINRRFSSRW